MQIETSDDNLCKLSALFKAIHSGQIDGVQVRQSMSVSNIAKFIGVSRKTFYEWKDGVSMPQPGNLRSIAQNLLRVKEEDLANYFKGVITLKELFAIRPKASSLEEVYDNFHTLDEPEQDIVLSLLLQDRAQRLGNGSIKKSRYKERHNADVSTSFLYKSFRSIDSEDMMIFFPWEHRTRLKRLMLASQEKLRYTAAQYRQAAESNGVSRDHAIIFYNDVIREASSSRPKSVVEGFLPLLFKVEGWDPLVLKDVTYDNLDDLLHDLDNFNKPALHTMV